MIYCQFQSFPDGAQNTSVHNKDHLISGFPGFMIDDSIVDLGYLSYGYIFVGDMGKTIGRLVCHNICIGTKINRLSYRIRR